MAGNHPIVQFFEDYGPYGFELLYHLRARSFEDVIECSAELMRPGEDELHHLPNGAVIDYHYGNAKTQQYAIGYMCFFHIGDVRYVAEQNVSPMIVWRNKNDDI